MKRRRWFARFLAAVLMVSALFQPGAGRIVLALEKELSEAPGEDPGLPEGAIAGGMSNSVHWVIDADGKLTVSGTGDYAREVRDGQGTVAPWWDYREAIVSAKVSVAGMTDASRMFYGCSRLTGVDLSGFDTGGVTDMRSMFYGCSSLGGGRPERLQHR